MLTFLRYGVIISFFICAISLCILVLKTLLFGKKPLYSEPQGLENKGNLYAFGKGMMPWEKESAARHLPTYIAGILYHSGIFAGLFYILLLVIPFCPGLFLINAMRILMLCGIACGVALFLKRIFKTTLKNISCPDDFASNILVDLFLFFALIDTFISSVRPVFLFAAILMLLYIPVGKIRHCFFFFYSRILFGLFYGRRGILPQKQRQFKV